MTEAVYMCQDPGDLDDRLILANEMPKDYYGHGSLYIPALPGPHVIRTLIDNDIVDIPLVEVSADRLSVSIENTGVFYFQVDRNDPQIYNGKVEDYRKVKWFELIEEDPEFLDVACQTYGVVFVGKTE